MSKEKKKKLVAIQKETPKEKKQNKLLEKLGFMQMVFDFYTTPLE